MPNPIIHKLKRSLVYTVIKDMARPILLGTSEVAEGPAMSVGMTVMRLMLFSSANFHAAFSASVFDTGYPCNSKIN